MTLLEFLNRCKRSFFYSIVISLGLLFSLEMLKDYGSKAFLIVVVGCSCILLFEIYLNWRLSAKVLKQVDMPILNAYSLWGHSLNHILLPLLLIYSFAAFIYINDDDLIRIISIVIYMVLNFLLFVNIRSYYLDEFKVEEDTNYIYDIIKLILYFFSVNVILHLGNLEAINTLIQGFFIGIFSVLLGFLILFRENVFELSAKLYVFAISVVIALVYMLALSYQIVLLGINIMTFLIFYFSI